MDTTLIIGVAIVVLAIAALVSAGYTVVTYQRSRHLRERFGPEYRRAVATHDSRSAAERDLRERERRHRDLELREIPPEQRDAYAAEWTRIQERFVDAPEGAAHDADALVNRIVAERGYDAADHERRFADLSVEHPRSVDHFRTARDINARAQQHEATTDELREAVVHYRALVADLLDLDNGRDRHRDHGRERERERTPEPAAATDERRDAETPRDNDQPAWNRLWRRLTRESHAQ